MKLCAALQSLGEQPCALCTCVYVCVLVVIAVVAAATACYLVPHEHLNAVEQFGSFSASKFSLEINNARSSSLSLSLSIATARQPFLTALIDVAMAAIIGHRGARVCVRELKNFYCIHLSSQHNFSLFATQRAVREVY